MHQPLSVQQGEGRKDGATDLEELRGRSLEAPVQEVRPGHAEVADADAVYLKTQLRVLAADLRVSERYVAGALIVRLEEPSPDQRDPQELEELLSSSHG